MSNNRHVSYNVEVVIATIMKIFFITSTGQLNTYKENYRAIGNAIKNLGHTLIRDWLEEAIKNFEAGKKIERAKVYPQVVKSIERADAIVVEGTVESFSVGHQVTLALQKEKPVLFLLFNDRKKKKEGLKPKNAVIESIKPSLLTTAEYTLENLKDILSNFFTLYRGGGKFRFNLMLDKDVRDYLNWASKFYKKNKSNIFRDLVRGAAKKDAAYKNRKIMIMKS